jgi:hypothetical protein
VKQAISGTGIGQGQQQPTVMKLQVARPGNRGSYPGGSKKFLSFPKRSVRF